MKMLLKILSSWEPKPGSQGLVLELSAHSPSDLQHRFRNFEMNDEYPFQCEEDLRRSPGVLEYSRQKYPELVDEERIRHRTSPRPTLGEHQRFQGTPLELRLWKKGNRKGHRNPISTLPEVPLVRGLLIRRQFYRGFAAISLAELFRQSFTSVEWFRLERWISNTAEDETSFIDGAFYNFHFQLGNKQ